MPETARIAPVRRPVTVEDVDAVCALLAACDVSVVGFADFTREEVLADLGSAELETYGWYDDGALAGYGWVARTAQSNRVQVDVYVDPGRPAALGHDVLAFLEERGRALAAAAGHAQPFFDVGVFRDDERTRGWLRAAGYDVRTTFTRMRIDLDGPVDVPPTDVAVRRATDERDLRTAHAVEDEAFVEHYGNVPLTFAAWQERLTRQGPDFAQVFLAELDGRPVGLLVSTRQFEDDDNAGYVRTLGVVPAGRGRGVARALLRDCFARAQRAGRAAVLLHVDVANVTGALRLYESVGMRPVLVIDAWGKGTLVDSRVDADTPG